MLKITKAASKTLRLSNCYGLIEILKCLIIWSQLVQALSSVATSIAKMRQRKVQTRVDLKVFQYLQLIYARDLMDYISVWMCMRQ